MAQKREAARTQRLKRAEQHRKALESLTPQEVERYLKDRESTAATQLQAWWRGEQGRKTARAHRAKQQAHHAAVTIQVGGSACCSDRSQKNYRGYRLRKDFRLDSYVQHRVQLPEVSNKRRFEVRFLIFSYS